MSEERLKVLELIQEGSITAEEGAKLLEALGQDKTASGRLRRAEAGSSAAARNLRIRVSHIDSGEVMASIRLPWRMVRAMGRLASGFMPEVMGIDLEEIVEAAEDGREGRIVEAVDEGESKRVEIFIEA